MSEIAIKIAGKEYQAKLSLDALERIESQFDNMSLGQIMVTKQGLRVAKAILIACISDSTPGLQMTDIVKALNKHAEDNGLDSLWEFVKTLVEASGFYGSKKAKEANLGKLDGPEKI